MAVLADAPPALTSPALTCEDRRRALQLALDSAVFRKNPRLSALLSYLCERAEDGNAEAPKEYSIATDVFGRSTRFDSSTDSIVRVEMYRLRRKLREFYEADGEHAELQIVLQAGDYRPQYAPGKAFAIARVTEPEAVAGPPLPATLHEIARLSDSRRRWWTMALVAVAACAVTGWYFWLRPTNRMAPAIVPAAIRAADASDTVRILCGLISGSVPQGMSEWGPDRFFSGGTATATPVQSLYRTRHPEIFRSARTGEFTYDIPLHRGPHQVKLYFADTSQSARSRSEGGENTRVFHVFANGSMLLQGFDIAADAGLDTADVRVFEDLEPAQDGKLHLSFVHVADASLINAIEITPSTGHGNPAVRMVTQVGEITTRDGRQWTADDYFREGRTLLRPIATPLTGGKDGSEADPIYAGERYGHFSYALPVPKGKYTARLYFSEYFWGPQEPGGGGKGSRIFDVYCNGQALWKNVDVYAEAGARRGLVKTAVGVEPNAQGKVVLSFVPVKNYAMVSAIELLDEGSSSEALAH